MLKILTFLALIGGSNISNSQTKEIGFDLRGFGCAGGRGLCTPIAAENSPINSTTKMYTTTKLDFNKMSFEIDPKQLSLEEQITFFGKEYRELNPSDEIKFLQDYDFIFDIDTLIYLDLDLAYRLLKRGFYPVTREKDKVTVTFTLSYHK